MREEIFVHSLRKLDGISEDTCELFVNILQCGNALEILSLKDLAKARLLQVINKAGPAQRVGAEEEFESIPEFRPAGEALSVKS